MRAICKFSKFTFEMVNSIKQYSVLSRDGSENMILSLK